MSCAPGAIIDSQSHQPDARDQTRHPDGGASRVYHAFHRGSFEARMISMVWRWSGLVCLGHRFENSVMCAPAQGGPRATATPGQLSLLPLEKGLYGLPAPRTATKDTGGILLVHETGNVTKVKPWLAMNLWFRKQICLIRRAPSVEPVSYVQIKTLKTLVHLTIL